MLLALALAAGILTGPVDTLVLSSGGVMKIEEVVTIENGAILFIGINGVLYSLPMSQIDLHATEARMNGGVEKEPEPAPVEVDASPRLPAPRDLPHTEEEKKRILQEIEEYSHTGRREEKSSQHQPSIDDADLEISVEGASDEEKWRSEARAYQMSIARLEDEIAIMQEREQQLNDQILFLAGNSGNADGYGYMVHQLQDLRTAIPLARARLNRLEREFSRFRTRARKQGVPPGWMR